jgi:NAD(P)H-binding
VLVGGSIAGIGNILLPECAVADITSTKPIAVLGASGRTGALCVAACLEMGVAVRALTRSGTWPPQKLEKEVHLQNEQGLLSMAMCDVKDPAAIRQSIAGCRGVIYAASASKNGGDARSIDNIAVVDAGEACIKENVGRYVVISSTATTRPQSLGYKFTNVLGGIMEQKRLGEVGVRDLYRTATGSSYTIIRPGGINEPKNVVLGPAALEVSQGDTLAGIVSRADLAQFAVELTLSNASNLRNTAVELYYTSSVQPCERRFKDFVTNGVAPRIHGESYGELLAGIQPNVDYYQG